MRNGGGEKGRKEGNGAATWLWKTLISRDQVVRAAKTGKKGPGGVAEVETTNGQRSVVKGRNFNRAGEESGGSVIAVVLQRMCCHIRWLGGSFRFAFHRPPRF